jgi:hypothetical protein
MAPPTTTYHFDINVKPTPISSGIITRSMRASAVHFATGVADQDAEDVTAILNEEAATSPRKSTKKRARSSVTSSEVGTPTTKRIRRQEPDTNDGVVERTPEPEHEEPTQRKSPRRQSSRRKQENTADDDVDEHEAEATQALEQPSTTKSPRRQSGQQNQESAPAEDVVESTPAPEAARLAATKSPRRESRRLQARKSLSTPLPVDQRNVFDVPDADGGAETDQIANLAKGPLTRVRLLARKPKNDPSPFKGRDIVETRTNARVNLDDSPRKRPAGRQPVLNRLERIGKSLGKKPARKAGNKDADNIPFGGEDVLATADIEIRDESPELGEAIPSTAAPKTVTKAKSPRKSPKDSVKTKASSQSTVTDTNGQKRMTKVAHRPRNPLLRAAQQAGEADKVTKKQPQPIEDGYDNAEDDEEDEATANDAEAEVPDSNHSSPLFVENKRADKDEAASQPTCSTQRIETEAQKENAERDEAAAEEERLMKLTAALKDVQEAAELHDCRKAWADALVAGNEIVEQRGPSKPRSQLGLGCERQFLGMIKVYNRIRWEDQKNGTRPLSTNERSLFHKLKTYCKALRDRSYDRHQSQNVEQYRMGRDLYEHLIPRSLELAKVALRARYRNKALDHAALQELCSILEITFKLAKTAQEWKPRPTLENQVKSKTASEIKPNVSAILANYGGVLDEHRRVMFVDDLAQRSAESVEREKELYRQKKEANRLKYRTLAPPTKPTESTRRPPQQQQATVRDIDEIVFDDDDDQPQSTQPTNNHINKSSSSARPPLRREPTEEIPAPDEPGWTEPEMEALLEGLQKFTDRLRWDNILKTYGHPRQPLHKYKKHELVSKAQWFKHSVESRLALELDDAYDWLRSVPG